MVQTKGRVIRLQNIAPWMNALTLP
jgi:hypothetical protein